MPIAKQKTRMYLEEHVYRQKVMAIVGVLVKPIPVVMCVVHTVMQSWSMGFVTSSGNAVHQTRKEKKLVSTIFARHAVGLRHLHLTHQDLLALLVRSYSRLRRQVRLWETQLYLWLALRLQMVRSTMLISRPRLPMRVSLRPRILAILT